jgi:ABC-2 type transport system ATP-binding protein
VQEIISVNNLSKSYHQIKALDSLDLSILEGDFFGFLGPNGAGKTTTIRLLTGIIKPDHGTIRIDGLSLDQKQRIARITGVVPESRGFYDWMTAREYLRFFAELYGIKGRQGTAIIDSLIGQVDLKGYVNRRIGAYSRGMKQRLGLARALINSPKILFLDEPTIGLDPQGQEDIQNLLRGSNQQGVTIFLSSHLLHEVSTLCSRIAIINKGRLVAQGTMGELRLRTNLKESYFFRIQGDIHALRLPAFLPRLNNVKNDGAISEFVFQGSFDDANQFLSELTKNVKILEFRAQADTLTDVFLDLISRS